jgi:hypothetical protein
VRVIVGVVASVHSPGVSVSVCPCRAVPDNLGGVVLVGPAAWAAAVSIHNAVAVATKKSKTLVRRTE